MHIAFLGLGAMGKPMAQSLVGLGHEVTVFSPTPGQAEDLAIPGVNEGGTLAQSVAQAEVVITVAADEATLSALVHGPDGLLAHLPPRSIHLCMSTIGIGLSAELARAHALADQGYVAAPAFGREGLTANRQLWFVAGGPEPQVNRCLPIFVALGRGLTRVGPKAALAHALKLGGDLILESLLEGSPALFSACREAEVAPNDFLRLLKAEFFKAPLADALGDIPVPNPMESPEFSSDLESNEMLTVLQAATEAVATRAVAVPSTVRSRPSNGRGPKGAKPQLPLPSRSDEAPSPPATIPEAPRPNPESALVEAPDPPIPSRAATADVAPPPALPVALDPPPVQAEPSRPEPPPALLVAEAPPPPDKATEVEPVPVPPRVDPAKSFMALEDGVPVLLDLDRTSHFELIKGQVWAWSQEKAFETQWRSFREVEQAFSQLLFHAIQRNLLVRPEAVLDLRMTFGGGAKVRVGEHQELEVSRSATPRLKVLLGL